MAIPKYFFWLWFALLIAVSIHIRLQGADQYHFNNDEAMHYNVAHATTLWEVLKYSLYETHPPFFYFLVHYWLQISDSPTFARGFALFFGILALPLYYAIGKRLNGELTGIYAATLVAFSPGWITQSFLLRHYTLFLFLLSYCLYCYLVWREKRSAALLFAYTVFACLSCVTHFSGILAVFCIAAYETVDLLRRKSSYKSIATWALVNLLPAAITLAAYHFWEPTLVWVKTYVDASIIDPITHLPPKPWKYVIFYPVEVAVYLFTNPLEALILLFLVPIAGWKNARIRPLLVLGGMAFVIGMLLFASSVYNVASARHYIWTFPFLILATSWVLADISLRWCKDDADNLSMISIFTTATVLLLMGWAMYDPTARYSDYSEYLVPERQWKSLSQELDTLGPNDLIVTNKDDAILLQNTYPYLEASPTSSEAIMMPFRHTHILFSPNNRRFFDKKFYATLFEAAQNQGFLKGIDRLVFYQTQWAIIVEPDLALCPMSHKQVLTFRRSNPVYGIKQSAAYNFFAKLTMVSKAAFFEQILSPDGKFYNCIRGRVDPQYVPPPVEAY